MGSTVIWEQIHLMEFAKQLNLLSNYYLKNPSVPRISMFDMDVTHVFHKRNYLKKCGCGEELVCIDCDGQTYACHLFSPITAPKHLAKASQSIDFSDHKQFVGVKCRDCMLFPLCTSCYGMNYLLTGDVSNPTPFTCRAFRIQFLSVCNFQLQIAESEGNKERVQTIQYIITQF